MEFSSCVRLLSTCHLIHEHFFSLISCMWTYTHTHMHTHAHTHLCTHAHMCAHTHAHAQCAMCPAVRGALVLALVAVLSASMGT